MLKALEYRCDVDEDKLTAGRSQLPVGMLAAADSELDVASSSTSCADSGRGLSCEVHDEPIKTLAAPARGTEPPGRSSEALQRNLGPIGLGRGTQPLGRGTEHFGRIMETFGRGTEQVQRNLEPVGCGSESAAGQRNTVVTVEDTLMAHTAALDACRQTLQLQSRSAVNVVGSAGMKQFCYYSQSIS